MNEIIVCSNCGHRFPDNPEKHKFRKKYCPNCRHPYRNAEPYILRRSPFEAIKRRLETVFKFFSERRGEEIYYVCPFCGYVAYSEQQLTFTRMPDKVREKPDGTFEILSWRKIPSCPECGTNMVRKRAR